MHHRLLPVLLAASLPLVAAHASATDGPQAPPRQAAVHRVRRQIAHDHAQVRGLEQQVKAQEAMSQEARDRLREQDRAIAELRRQLKAYRAGSSGTGVAGS